MSYKTIMTVCTDIDLLSSTLNHAHALAQGHDAHLDVLCVGVDRTQTGYYASGANALIMQQTLTQCHKEAEILAGDARVLLERLGGRWSLKHRVAQVADIGRSVAAHARFSDLMVLPRPYGDKIGIEIEPVLEGALFEGGVPVVVVPEAIEPSVHPRKVVLAWNESAEALRAVRLALPILKAADLVHVAVIDPPRHGSHRSDPGGVLAEYLGRHDVKTEISVLARTLPRVSEVLMRHVSDVNAQMVVMGAYGHSRFRESILGGATRDMLEQSKMTVFMAH